MIILLRYGISILNNVKLPYKVMGVMLHQYVYPIIINISYQGQVMDLLRYGISILINVKLSYKVIGIVLHPYVYPMSVMSRFVIAIVILQTSGRKKRKFSVASNIMDDNMPDVPREGVNHKDKVRAI